ncbi:MAG: hypothetical protein GPJ54_16345 [Candidatus Heimdallarchaeota archaeon]|nr:hypothetical protein [Candidatus Heimdallarchaeota archaeon]
MLNKRPLYNFSWIEKGVIAGSSVPSNLDHFNFLLQNKIKVIINLTEKSNYGVSEDILSNFTIHNIPVEDFSAPSINQLIEFRDLVKSYKDKSYPVLVHCFAGCGRTGTFLASYLLDLGTSKTAVEAINTLRIDRPCSVETEDQEKILDEYQDLIISDSG